MSVEALDVEKLGAAHEPMVLMVSVLMMVLLHT